MEEKQTDKPVGENPKSKSQPKSEDVDWVFVRYIVKNGKVIYPKNATFFRFPRYTPKRKTV